MRDIATLVLAVLLVAGTVPAIGVAGAAQHGTDARYTTDIRGPDGVVLADSSGGGPNDSDAAVTGYEIEDRTLAPGEPLRVRITGEGEGSTPVILSLDGERHRLGTVAVSPDGASFDPDSTISWPDVEVHCEGGYDSEDGWWLECEIDISLAAVGAGPHDVGVNDLEPTRIEVERPDRNVTVTDYEVADRTVHPGEPMRVNVSYEGESGSTPLTMSVDGERYRVGTVHVDDGRARFEAADGEDAPPERFVPVPCPDFPYPTSDGTIILCWPDPFPLPTAEGLHEVAIDGMEPTTVAAGEELEMTDYEVAGTVPSANDSDATVDVYMNASSTVEVRGEGVGEAALALVVDGERHRLGTVAVSPDGASFDPDSTISWPDVEVHCEGGYDSEDGWWLKCEIDVSLAAVGTGPHDVGVNDLEPTRIDVEPAEAQLADYDVQNRTVRAGETLRIRTTFEGESGAVPIVVSVDGESYRAGTVHVEDGVVTRVETADASSAPINFVPCPDLQDDRPWIVVWCAQDVPAAAQGTHEVALNDMAPTTITVEAGNSGPIGGVLDAIGDLLDDVLRWAGDLPEL